MVGKSWSKYNSHPSRQGFMGGPCLKRASTSRFKLFCCCLDSLSQAWRKDLAFSFCIDLANNRVIPASSFLWMQKALAFLFLFSHQFFSPPITGRPLTWGRFASDWAFFPLQHFKEKVSRIEQCWKNFRANTRNLPPRAFPLFASLSLANRAKASSF